MFIHDIRRDRLRKALKKARLDAGLRQIDVADALQKPQSYIAKVESGERRIDFIEVIDFCNAVDTDPVTLIRAVG